jgi:hypothetical protein
MREKLLPLIFASLGALAVWLAIPDRCKDGTMSHSKEHSGACSHDGGVAESLDKGKDERGH